MSDLSDRLRDLGRGVRRRLGASTRSTRRFLRELRVVKIRNGPAEGLRIGMRHASNDYRDGSVEAPVQRAVASLVSPGCVFFDIGANVGFFTLVAWKAAGGEASLFAFEPRPDIADSLVANLRRNDIDATVWPVAVGEREGLAALLVAVHPGGATIEPDKAYDTARIRHVPMVAIDELVEAGRLPVPDVVKIDVEGAEPAVLRGMSRTLQLARTRVVYEIDAPDPELAEAQFQEVDALLTDLGYASTRLERSYADSGWHVIHAVAVPPAEIVHDPGAGAAAPTDE